MSIVDRIDGVTIIPAHEVYGWNRRRNLRSPYAYDFITSVEDASEVAVHIISDSSYSLFYDLRDKKYYAGCRRYSYNTALRHWKEKSKYSFYIAGDGRHISNREQHINRAKLFSEAVEWYQKNVVKPLEKKGQL